MGNDKHSRDEWARDIEARQRNVVFPDTVQNETRFWRNLGNQPWTPVTKIGLGILAVFVLGIFGVFAYAIIEGGGLGGAVKFALIAFLIWGPVFGAIAWATRRALRNSSHSSRRQK